MTLKCITKMLPIALLVALPAFAADTTRIEPDATDALNRMSSYLKSIKSFAISASMASDLVLADGQKIQVDNTVDFAVNKPNQLFVQSYGASFMREATFDGKLLTIYSEPSMLYASTPSEKSLQELLDIAATEYGIGIPLSDLIVWGNDPQAKITSAVRVGPMLIGDKACQLYAFRQQNVDWQACITEGKDAIPLKLVVSSMDLPGQPQNVYYLEWRVNPTFNADAFKFTPPKGAQRVKFAALPKAKQ